MQQVIYTLHFRGQASPSADNAKVLKTTSSGTSCTMNTVVAPDGVETTLHPAAGDLAFLESEIRLIGGDSFEGEGVMSFGDDARHAVRFRSVQSGHLSASDIPGTMAGVVGWRVEGGSGRFASATGFVSSTFTLTESGELSEYHCGLIFVRD